MLLRTTNKINSINSITLFKFVRVSNQKKCYDLLLRAANMKEANAILFSTVGFDDDYLLANISNIDVRDFLDDAFFNGLVDLAAYSEFKVVDKLDDVIAEQPFLFVKKAMSGYGPNSYSLKDDEFFIMSGDCDTGYSLSPFEEAPSINELLGEPDKPSTWDEYDEWEEVVEDDEDIEEEEKMEKEIEYEEEMEEEIEYEEEMEEEVEEEMEEEIEYEED